MSYLGRVKPVETTSSVTRSTYTGDGSTTTYNLPTSVSNETEIVATINGVTQQDAAYSTNGSQIIFSSAPASGDAIELRVLGGVGLGYAPPDGSVVTGKIADGAVTNAKMASGAAVANIGSRAIAVSQVPAGSIIQVVNYQNADDDFFTSSSTYVDLVSLNITPQFSNSKILIMFSGVYQLYGNSNTTNITAYAQLLRNSTEINGSLKEWAHNGTVVNNQVATAFPSGFNWIDSPNTTSTITYKIQHRALNSARVGTVQNTFFSLMEIAQ